MIFSSFISCCIIHTWDCEFCQGLQGLPGSTLCDPLWTLNATEVAWLRHSGFALVASPQPSSAEQSRFPLLHTCLFLLILLTRFMLSHHLTPSRTPFTWCRQLSYPCRCFSQRGPLSILYYLKNENKLRTQCCWSSKTAVSTSTRREKKKFYVSVCKLPATITYLEARAELAHCTCSWTSRYWSSQRPSQQEVEDNKGQLLEK